MALALWNEEKRMESPDTSDVGRTLEDVGAKILRYGLVVILPWVGALKFTADGGKQ